jgi:hypothetical protein
MHWRRQQPVWRRWAIEQQSVWLQKQVSKMMMAMAMMTMMMTMMTMMMTMMMMLWLDENSNRPMWCVGLAATRNAKPTTMRMEWVISE